MNERNPDSALTNNRHSSLSPVFYCHQPVHFPLPLMQSRENRGKRHWQRRHPFSIRFLLLTVLIATCFCMALACTLHANRDSKFQKYAVQCSAIKAGFWRQQQQKRLTHLLWSRFLIWDSVKKRSTVLLAECSPNFHKTVNKVFFRQLWFSPFSSVKNHLYFYQWQKKSCSGCWADWIITKLLLYSCSCWWYGRL